jgi:septal ring factor EnvC (AmiA/AmiB activator)
MTEPNIIHVLGVVWKWMIAPLAVVAWWLFKKRDAAVQERLKETDEKIDLVNKRLNAVEKDTAVIHAEISGITKSLDRIEKGVGDLHKEIRNGKKN